MDRIIRNIVASPAFRTHLIALGMILLAVGLLFHRLLLGEVIATNDLGGNDLLYYHYPMDAIYGEALRSGELLQWSPNIYAGYPVFAEGQGGYLYPPNLLLWGLLKPVTAMNAYILLHAVLMGLGMYAFTGRLTKSWWHALPAGVAASVCGSVIAGHTRHLNVLAIIALMPWLFFIAESYLGRPRPWLGGVFGALLAMMILAGHPPHAFMAACYATAYMMLRRYLRLGPIRPEGGIPAIPFRSLLAFFALAIVAAFLISLPQLAATAELAGFSRRLSDPASFKTTIGSMNWNGFLSLFHPYFDGNIGDATFKPREVYMFWENFYYVGAIITALAVWGTVRMWRQGNVALVLVLITLVCYLLALGDHFILYKLFSYLPVIGEFRFPVRWFLIAELGTLALSGYGVAALAGTVRKRFMKTERVDVGSGHRWIAAALAVLALAEIFIVAGRQVVTDPPESYLSPSNFAVSMRAGQVFGRMLSTGVGETYDKGYGHHRGWEKDRSIYKLAAALVPPNLPAPLHIACVDGYNSLVPYYLYQVWGDSHGLGRMAEQMPYNPASGQMEPSAGALRVLRMWGVRYFPSLFPLPAPFVRVWDTVGAADIALYGYELPNTFPRAWVVAGTVSAGSGRSGGGVDMLFGEQFDPATQAIVDDTLPALPPDAANGSVEILKATNHHLTLRANVPGLVVISDTWYPRWKAKVDGADATVLRVNSGMRGVVAPRAGSVIEMRYDSGGLVIYCGIALMALVSLGVYAVRNL